MARSRAPQRHKAQREDIEGWLQEKDVIWTFVPDVDLEEFDLNRSLRNQARINQVLSPERLETYTEAMKRGDKFPAVIAYKVDGKYVAIDGNHRLHAAKNAEQTVSVYELDPKTKANTIITMTYEANAKHGLPNSVEDRQLHAVYLLRSGAANQETVAASLNLSKSQVSAAWQKAKADDRANKVGLLARQWDVLSAATKSRLGAVRTDEGFEALADLAYRAQLGSKEVDQHVTEINRFRSGREQKDAVEKLKAIYRSRIQQSSGGTLTRNRNRGPKLLLLMGCGNVNALEDNIEGIVNDCQLAEIPDVIKTIENAAAVITLVVDALKAKQKGA